VCYGSTIDGYAYTVAYPVLVLTAIGLDGLENRVGASYLPIVDQASYGIKGFEMASSRRCQKREPVMYWDFVTSKTMVGKVLIGNGEKGGVMVEFEAPQVVESLKAYAKKYGIEGPSMLAAMVLGVSHFEGCLGRMGAPMSDMELEMMVTGAQIEAKVCLFGRDNVGKAHAM